MVLTCLLRVPCSCKLRFELAAGLGEPWTRDGGIPQGCPLSMMFIVALFLPWCKYLAAQEGVEPQLYADNLECVLWDPGVLLRAARFTAGYVRLVGQEPAAEYVQGCEERYAGLVVD